MANQRAQLTLAPRGTRLRRAQSSRGERAGERGFLNVSSSRPFLLPASGGEGVALSALASFLHVRTLPELSNFGNPPAEPEDSLWITLSGFIQSGLPARALRAMA